MFNPIGYLIALHKERQIKKAKNRIKLTAKNMLIEWDDLRLAVRSNWTCCELFYKSRTNTCSAKYLFEAITELRIAYVEHVNTTKGTTLSLNDGHFICKQIDRTASKTVALQYVLLRKEWLQFIIDYKG